MFKSSNINEVIWSVLNLFFCKKILQAQKHSAFLFAYLRFVLLFGCVFVLFCALVFFGAFWCFLCFFVSAKFFCKKKELKTALITSFILLLSNKQNKDKICQFYRLIGLGPMAFSAVFPLKQETHFALLFVQFLTILSKQFSIKG